jgi:inner membrane protein
VGIVDLFYTLPLILVLAVIMFINRSSQLRRKLIMSVVFLTTAYLGATAVNKLYVNSVFKNAFAEKNIEYERFKTSALPLSNFLWMGLAETDSGYYMGLYSNFDSEKPQEFMFIDRNHDKLQGFAQDEGLHKLIQFTKGWYHVGEDKNGLYLVDLRFGKAGLDENADYIFKFNIKETANSLIITQSKESRNIEPKAFKAFIDRIKGI